jgi:hypothetical protein
VSRRVITNQMQATSASPIDTYFAKVIKYIPADIVGAWVAATGLIATAGAAVPANVVLWICFVVGVLITPLWVLRQTREPGLPPAYIQAGISTGAFVVWVFALGGPFATLAFYHPLYGSLLLIFYTLLTAFVDQ